MKFNWIIQNDAHLSITVCFYWWMDIQFCFSSHSLRCTVFSMDVQCTSIDSNLSKAIMIDNLILFVSDSLAVWITQCDSKSWIHLITMKIANHWDKSAHIVQPLIKVFFLEYQGDFGMRKLIEVNLLINFFWFLFDF